jgi:hypothetical protein
MCGFWIEQDNGTVKLPNDFVIDADLTQDQLRQSALMKDARAFDCGTLPFIHFDIDAGEIQNKPVLGRLSFYDQLLLSIDLTVDLYPVDQHGWEYYSLDVEKQTKRLHEQILVDMLDSPTPQMKLSQFMNKISDKLLNHDRAWEKPMCWNYVWGTVGSYYDSRGGSTGIIIHYAGRHEKANRDYQAKHAR